MAQPILEPMKPSSNSFISTAWLVVMLLWPVAMLNYLDRQMLAAMKTSMMNDIAGIQLEQNWGFILGSFKWVYAVFSPIGGYFADRWSRRHVISASLLIWSLVTWLTGHVSTYQELVWTRALMGISEAIYIPAALAMIADFHVGPTRSRAIGIHQTAIYVGILLGGFSGYVADEPSLGWRFAFTACGVAGVAYAFPLFIFLKNPPAREHASESLSPINAGLELFKNPSYLLLVLYFTLPALAGWVMKDWMPAILKQQFGLSQGKAGVSAVVYVQVASLIGVALGGWLSDAWMRRNVRGRIFVSAIGMSFFLPALYGVGSAGTLAVAIGFLMFFGLGWGFFDCNNMPILCQIIRPQLRATGYGIMNMVSISFGGFADWGFGYLRDREVPLNVIFGAFSAIALLSVIVVLLIRPKESLLTGDRPIAH